MRRYILWVVVAVAWFFIYVLHDWKSECMYACRSRGWDAGRVSVERAPVSSCSCIDLDVILPEVP